MYYDIHKCIIDTAVSGHSGQFGRGRRDLGLEISGGPGVANLEARQAGPSQARTMALSGEPGQASKSATARLGPKMARPGLGPAIPDSKMLCGWNHPISFAFP